MMANYVKCLLVILLCAACSPREDTSPNLTGQEILQKSIAIHDPNQKWKTTSFHFHIQEPRLSNPSRYSEVKWDNAAGTFELIRNRETHLSTHVIDAQGNATVLLDDSEVIADSLVEKFRLMPERNEIYREFYAMMYGLPMALDEEWVEKIGEVTIEEYHDQACYKLPITLKKEMFSKKWQVYLATASFEFKGMEIIDMNDPTKGESLFFDGSIVINGIRIPRIRHWYDYETEDYLGSDIIVNNLQNQ